MPGFTPNRNFPYSLPGDPADIPAAIQALAEAVDLDAEAMDAAIVRRPMALVSSRTAVPQVFPSDAITACVFDFTDLDSSGISDLAAFPTRLTPTTAGLWLAWGEVVIPNFTSQSKNLRIQVNGADTFRSSNYFDVDGRLASMTMGAIFPMDGINDYFELAFTPGTSNENVSITGKRFACLRLTNT